MKQPAMADNRNESREGPCAGRTEDEYLAGAMSPLSGYSSGEDASFERFSRSESGASTDFVGSTGPAVLFGGDPAQREGLCSP